MSQLGMGVMIRMLSGNAEAYEVFQGALGKTIARAWSDDAGLYLRFTDGTGVKFSDEGQSCCESRYMRTDDRLDEFVGAALVNAELRAGPSVEDDNSECHDVQFLVVQTDRGNITMSNHNEHNGYYGGFAIDVARLTPEPAA